MVVTHACVRSHDHLGHHTHVLATSDTKARPGT